MPPPERSRSFVFSGQIRPRIHVPIRSGVGTGGQPSALQERNGRIDPVTGVRGPAALPTRDHATRSPERAAVPVPAMTETETASLTAEESAEILRFRRSERQLHWAIAVPFMVCLTTAAILVFLYNPNPARPYRAIFSWIHRLSGLCLGVLPTWSVLRHRADFMLHFHNVRGVWSWTMEDVKWLLLMGPSTLNKKISLPHQGKFNAAEKINFMVLTATWPMYVLTGVLIWLPGVAFLSWLVHITMAAMAIPLILGHVFMATVNPDTRVGLPGMISGFVNRHWARHHYRRWYDENFPAAIHPPKPVPMGPAIVTRAAPDATAARAVASVEPEGRESPLPGNEPWPAAVPNAPAARPFLEKPLSACG